MIYHVVILEYSAPSVDFLKIDMDKAIQRMKDDDIYDPSDDDSSIIYYELSRLGYHLSNCEFMYNENPFKINHIDENNQIS